MFYVYLLKLKNGRIYTGFTSNLKIRLNQHHEGKVKSTYKLRPVLLVYYEGYLKEKDARRNEKYYKTSKGKKDVRKKLRSYLELSNTGP
ncbi:MAG: GIY-YIG nuclease family protein [Parcubacteria group bacterium]